jgi:hypothetical protein
MFTVEIRVNTLLVAHVYGRNLGKHDGKTCEYLWEYYELEKGAVIQGIMRQPPGNGIAPLVAKILTKVSKEKAK